MYYFASDCTPNNLYPFPGNFRKDQYMWVNHGPKAIPAKDPVIQKRYYVAKLPDGRPSRFHKSVYNLLNDIRPLKPCIVQYMGSMDGIAVSTKKSRIQAERGIPDLTPISQGKKTKCSSSNPNLLTMIRPLSIQPKKFAISRDDLKVLHEYAYNLYGIIHSIQLAPTFQCVIGLRDISDHLETLLQANTGADSSIQFSYSSSFEIGELILSPLMFSHAGFEGKPAIPSHFIIHEKGDKSAHTALFQVVQEMVPRFKTILSPIVTEGDEDKNMALTEMGLNLIPISSWKSVILEIKEWLYAHGATQQEVATGIEDIRSLMCSDTLGDYASNLVKCKENWGEPFQDYYMSKIDSLVQDKLGKWNIEKWGVFNPYTGVNDKSSDSLDLVVQQLQAWGSASCDAIVVACYLVQHYIRKEIRDGANGIGRLVASDEVNTYKSCILSWKPIPFLCLPENIVHYVKDQQLIVQDGALVEHTDADAKKTLLNKGKRIYESKAVHLDVSMQAFLVKDWERPTENFIVRLFPRATCTCDSAMLCQHIIAVKLSIGTDMESEMARLDSKFVTRALKSCENAAEGIKTRRRRRKRPIAESPCFVSESPLKRGGQVPDDAKVEPTSEDGDSENESEANSSVQENSQVDFFQNGVQIAASAFFS